MSDVRQFQALVLESAYMSKRTTFRNYVYKVLKIREDYGLTEIAEIQLFSHFQKKLNDEVTKEVFNEYEYLPIALQYYKDEGYIDEDGNIAEWLREELKI